VTDGDPVREHQAQCAAAGSRRPHLLAEVVLVDDERDGGERFESVCDRTCGLDRGYERRNSTLREQAEKRSKASRPVPEDHGHAATSLHTVLDKVGFDQSGNTRELAPRAPLIVV
jgi:hypothetical protein